MLSHFRNLLDAGQQTWARFVVSTLTSIKSGVVALRQDVVPARAQASTALNALQHAQDAAFEAAQETTRTDFHDAVVTPFAVGGTFSTYYGLSLNKPAWANNVSINIVSRNLVRAFLSGASNDNLTYETRILIRSQEVGRYWNIRSAQETFQVPLFEIDEGVIPDIIDVAFQVRGTALTTGATIRPQDQAFRVTLAVTYTR